MSEESAFDLERVRAGLRTTLLGRRLIWRESVDSTQEELRRLLEQGAAAGTVVVANHQTAGRGRRGHVWHDRPGEDLLFSVAFPPGLRAEGLLPVALGAYLAEALTQETQQEVRLSWPNNLVIGASKLGGVLVEVAGGNFLVGVGLNVKGQAAEVAQQVGRSVTTLEAGLERPLWREEVLATCLNALARAHEQLASGDRGPATRKIADLDSLRGKSVIIIGPQGVTEGTALGIALDGALLVRSGAAITEVTVADDITVQEA
jgi:BirA family biotin operon repressor/biotin-[acetyl-CoA-carboxylase] ligase